MSAAIITSDRLTLLAPDITEETRKIARDRVFNRRVTLIKEKDILTPEARAQIKMALILVKIMNPFEELYEPEEALLRGISGDRLAKHKTEERHSHHPLFTPM